ncbi:MAG: hypothetical protein KJ077_19975 [Anaerolineae bacterium]|nr:hypothetical protein [Anaerolineae bacterium]
MTSSFNLPLEIKGRVYTKKPKKNEPGKPNLPLTKLVFNRFGVFSPIFSGFNLSARLRDTIRYWSSAKTHLQAVLTAAALNVVRLVAAWLEDTPRATTLQSPLVKLVSGCT